MSQKRSGSGGTGEYDYLSEEEARRRRMDEFLDLATATPEETGGHNTNVVVIFCNNNFSNSELAAQLPSLDGVVGAIMQSIRENLIGLQRKGEERQRGAKRGIVAAQIKKSADGRGGT